MKHTVLFMTLFCLAVALGAQPLSAAPAGDAWLAKIALSELDRCAENGEFEELTRRIKGAILGRLSTGKVRDLAVMTELVYVMRACEYGKVAAEMTFNAPDAPKSDALNPDAKPAPKKKPAPANLPKSGKELFKWLVANRPLAKLLFRAMRDLDEPAEALTAIAYLKAAGEKAVLAFPELSVAFATTSSAEPEFEQLNASSLIDSFKYYTTRKFRYDLKSMPYELSRYLTDTRLSMTERLWAYGRYNKRAAPARSYFDVKYDSDHYTKGLPKKISKLAFTLPNLRKVGGVCIEQAYYSAEVCKALGVPATVVSGQGKDGVQHAWLACLKMSGRKVAWDSTTGRYESQKYYVGDVRRPTGGGEKLLDCELLLLGSAALLPAKRRQEADTATALAKVAADIANAGEFADLKDLLVLAALHNRRFGSGAPDAAKLKATVKVDMSVVEDFIAMALDNNLAHGAAWDFLLVLRRERDMLEVSHLGRFFDFLITKTGKTFPDYSCQMIMRIVPGIPEAKQRLAIYGRAMKVYARRPDLKGRLTIAIGDDYAGEKIPKMAYKAYETAAMQCVNTGDIAVIAAARAEKLLAGAGGRKVAIALYKKLFARCRREKSSFATQTSYYRLGTRFADLLEASGQDTAAARIRTKLKSVAG